MMLGEPLSSLGLPEELPVPVIAVKVPVFPFVKFPGVDSLLGPEMKSTGEVMGISTSSEKLSPKVRLRLDKTYPSQERPFFPSITTTSRPSIAVARKLSQLGFRLIATRGTADYLRAAGINVEHVYKVNEGRPNIVDRMVSGKNRPRREYSPRRGVFL